MRVFLLTQWYPSPESPISGVFIQEHARAISLYHQVNVVYVKGIDHARSNDWIIHRAAERSLAEVTISYRKPRIPKTAWILRIRKVFQYFDNLSDAGYRPDIIHANVYNTADLAVMLGKRYRIPVVMTEHATTFPRRLFNRFQALKVRFFINNMQMVLPVSHDLSRHMSSYGIHGPYRIIPNTVDTQLFKPGTTKPSDRDGVHRILVVANLIEIKGIDLLMKSLGQLKDKGFKFRLMIVGDGPERDNLLALAGRLNIAPLTTFYGLRNKKEIAELMKTADILALTSLWENQPVVILEALASGLPVLASRIAGIPEVLTPTCGRMAEPGNVQSIGENLELLLDNLDDYPADAIAQYAHSRFSYEAVSLLFSQAYEQVIKDYNSA